MPSGVIRIGAPSGWCAEDDRAWQAQCSSDSWIADILPSGSEEEEGVFFYDSSAYGDVIKDDVLARPGTFNNVIITSHLAFLTKEALTNIANTTLQSIVESKEGKRDADLPNSAVPMPG
jgi:hypothetical protein